MKKKQNRHSLHLIRQNVPQFILLVIFSVLLGVSVIAVSVLMKMFLDIATNASTMPLTTCLIIAVGVLLVLGSRRSSRPFCRASFPAAWSFLCAAPWWSTYTAQTLGRSTAARRNHRRHAHRRCEPRQLLLRPIPAHFGLDGRGQRSEGLHKPHRRDPLHAHRK